MKTNKELGAVYLEVDGLDKERFKELTKGMDFYNSDVNCELNKRFIENYVRGSLGKTEWIGLRHERSLDPESKKITLDELEQLLNQKKDMKIEDVVVISKEDYQRFVELESKEKKRIDYSRLKTGSVVKLNLDPLKDITALTHANYNKDLKYTIVLIDNDNYVTSNEFVYSRESGSTYSTLCNRGKFIAVIGKLKDYISEVISY